MFSGHKDSTFWNNKQEEILFVRSNARNLTKKTRQSGTVGSYFASQFVQKRWF